MGGLAVEEEGVFRGVRRRGDEVAGLRVRDEHVEVELGRALHDRIGAFEKGTVAGEEEVVPEMLAEPGGAGHGGAPRGGFARGGEAPWVRQQEGNPAACVVVGFGGLLARSNERLDQGEERFVQLGEVGDLGRPVVHLHVDVGVPVAIPCGLDLVGPDALQIRGQAAGAGGRDEQVTAEAEVERGEGGIGRACVEGAESIWGGASGDGGIRCAEVEGDAVEGAAVVGDVRGAERGEILRGGAGEVGLGGDAGVGDGSAGEGLDVGRGGDEQQRGVGVAHAESVTFEREGAAGRNDTDAGGVAHAGGAAEAVVDLSAHEQAVGAGGFGGEAFGAVEAGVEGDAARGAGGEAENKSFGRCADEGLAGVAHAVLLVVEAADGLGEVEGAAVVFDLGGGG